MKKQNNASPYLINHLTIAKAPSLTNPPVS